MNPDYSITLTPSHASVPSLMDFIIDHAEKPYPTRAFLVGMLTTLDHRGIRHVNMRVSKGEWHVEFIVNENMKIHGIGTKFNEALSNAISEVASWRTHAAAPV